MTLFLYALRNLRRNKLRNFLTLLGVAAGMAVLLASISVTQNFRSQLDAIIADTGSDIMIQSLRATTPMLSRITHEDVNSIQARKDISSTSSVIMGFLKTPWAPYFLILGISSAEDLAAQLRLVEGRWFEPQKKELVLGYLSAKEMAYSTGDTIYLSDNTVFQITGIYSFGYPMADGAAVMDINTARSLLNRDDSVNMILANIAPNADPMAAIQAINSDFPNLYASSGKDFVGQVRFFDSVELFTWILSMVSLITCCLVVVNTLAMSVSERIKEIGILLAIGWNGFMIYRIILYESIILCLSGTLFGSFGAMIALKLLQGSKALGLGLIPAHISLDIVLLGCGLALVLGALCSLYPAFLTMKLSPAQAIRHE
jgi:putative ABC transport system permease protein